MQHACANILRYLLILLSLFTLTSCSEKALTQPATSSSAVIFVYHHISDDTPAITSISPERFVEHLNFLQQQNFTIWSLTQLIDAQQQHRNIPDKVVSITFDDAYQSIYQQAYPELKKRGLPFTVFVSPNDVDEQHHYQMSWDQLREMSNHGATIANHSFYHLHLLQKEHQESHAQWLTRVSVDIESAQQRIKQEIGSDYRFFAFPYGEYNSDLKDLIKQLGYIAFGQQSGAMNMLASSEVIPRFPVAGHYTSIADFALKASTLAMPATVTIDTENPLLHDQTRPTLKLSFDSLPQKSAFQCFGHDGELNVTWQEATAIITTTSPIPVGRSRYNCTLATERQRYYWFSKIWIRLAADNQRFID